MNGKRSITHFDRHLLLKNLNGSGIKKKLLERVLWHSVVLLEPKNWLAFSYWLEVEAHFRKMFLNFDDFKMGGLQLPEFWRLRCCWGSPRLRNAAVETMGKRYFWAFAQPINSFSLLELIVDKEWEEEEWRKSVRISILSVDPDLYFAHPRNIPGRDGH